MALSPSGTERPPMALKEIALDEHGAVKVETNEGTTSAGLPCGADGELCDWIAEKPAPEGKKAAVQAPSFNSSDEAPPETGTNKGCITVARKCGQHKLYSWHVFVAGLQSGSHMSVKVAKYRSRLWLKPFENLLSN